LYINLTQGWQVGWIPSNVQDEVDYYRSSKGDFTSTIDTTLNGATAEWIVERGPDPIPNFGTNFQIIDAAAYDPASSGWNSYGARRRTGLQMGQPGYVIPHKPFNIAVPPDVKVSSWEIDTFTIGFAWKSTTESRRVG
jgi:hypothetical protein